MRQARQPILRLSSARELASKLRRLAGSATQAATENLIWIDTLCCPTDPLQKIVALERLRQVYQEATTVLVLDASLQSSESRGMGIVEDTRSNIYM